MVPRTEKRHLRLSSKMAFSCSYQSETLTAKPPLKKQVFVQYTFGGDDGNRTRVQKPLDITFSVGSQSIRIPTSERRVTGFRQGSLLMHDRYKGNSRFMFTTDLTHGGSRSPHPRYGRLKSRVTAYAARATELLSFII